MICAMGLEHLLEGLLEWFGHSVGTQAHNWMFALGAYEKNAVEMQNEIYSLELYFQDLEGEGKDAREELNHLLQELRLLKCIPKSEGDPF